MKKLILTMSIIFLLAFYCFSWSGYEAFFDTAIDVNAGVTKTDGTEFTSNKIILIGKSAAKAGITFTFDRAAGSASTVDVIFEASFDGGTTWATIWDTSDVMKIQVPTNTAAVTGTTVRAFFQLNLNGASHIKVKSIYNSDGANDITGVNLFISY